jgi:osmotically inducible protein OsmC
MISTIKPLVTIAATCTGGRNGHSETADKLISVDLSLPKEMGGPGLPGRVTPEHLFATGYAACFGGAVDFVARKHRKDETKATVTCAVSVGPREAGGLGLMVKMNVVNSQVSQADLEKFVREAHEEICPYSHATRGNVAIDFEVKGA